MTQPGQFKDLKMCIWTGYIYVRLTTRPAPPNRPIPTTGPIPTNGPISKFNPTNEPIFPTTGPTFKRHVHKWADRIVKRDVSSRQCDEDQTAVYMRRAIILITYPYGDFKHLLLYANTPMQYTAIFTAVKMPNFS